jgi:hypothetical protein
MPTFYGAIDLVQNELRNAKVQNQGSAPGTPVTGQLWYDSANNILKWWNGSGWVAAQGGAGAVPATTVTTQAVGDAAVVGTATTYAREDHKHGREAFGAITAETVFGSASGNGAALTLARSDHIHGNPVHDDAAHAAIHLSALGLPQFTVGMNNQRLASLGDPQTGTDAANKNYVDNLVAGLSWKDSVRLTGIAGYNLTPISGTGQNMDGVLVNSGDRILLKTQTTASENGIWVAASGAWTRATDADSGTEILGTAVFVEQGTTNADTAWVCTNDSPITIGTTGLTFVQFAGGGSVTAGAGMTQTGNVLNVITGDTSLIVNADELHVNTAVMATVASLAGYGKKFAVALTGTASPETITHNLNTQDIMLMVHNGASPYTSVEVDWDATTVNTAVIRYNPNLGAGYRAVVMG